MSYIYVILIIMIISLSFVFNFLHKSKHLCKKYLKIIFNYAKYLF